MKRVEAVDEPFDRASVDHVLRTTRSVRKYIDLERPVEPRVIEECVDLALQAPTGGRNENWRFLVITEPERKCIVAELYRRAFDDYVARQPEAAGAERPTYRLLADRLHEMPALILACIEGRSDGAGLARQVAHLGSILPATWSLMLALRTRGLGATWTTLHLVHEAEAAAALGIPSDVTQTVLLPVGYMRGARLRPAERRPAREVTFWNEWGNTDEPG
jgi:nitroreductase